MGARQRGLNAPSRLAGVDLARGLAMLGMFAAHLLTTAGVWNWTDPGTWSSIVVGRSSILFATLAGVSIGLTSGGPDPMTGARLKLVRGRLAVRAGMLWLIGVLLVLTGVPVYVILPAYGILFLFALPFLPLRASTLLVIAAGVALVMPWFQPLLDEIGSRVGSAELLAVLGWQYPFTVWLAFVLAGMGVARINLTSAATALRLLGAGVGLALIGYGFDALPDPDGPFLTAVWQATPHSSGLLEVVGSGGFAIAVLGACLLLCRVRVIRMLTLPLRAIGYMPLTAYTAQLVIWALLALALIGTTSDLLAFRALEPFWPLTIGLLAACTVWAQLFGRGPLERLLDRTARLVVPDRLGR